MLDEVLKSAGQTTRPIGLPVTSHDASASDLDGVSGSIEKRGRVTRDEGKGKRYC